MLGVSHEKITIPGCKIPIFMVSHPVATFFAALTAAGITGLAGAQVAADFLDLKMLGSYKSTYGVSCTGGTK